MLRLCASTAGGEDSKKLASLFLRESEASGWGWGGRGWGFPGGTRCKESACLLLDARDEGSIPKSERSPGGGNGNPLGILAWEISWKEKPGRLQSMGSQRIRHD